MSEIPNIKDLPLSSYPTDKDPVMAFAINAKFPDGTELPVAEIDRSFEPEYFTKLFCAAPDLLAACKAFIELFEESDMRPEGECHELYSIMEDAILKATAQ